MLGLRASAASRRGQGSLARVCAAGCAHQSAMSLRAACSVCVALHHLALSAGRGQEGQIAGAVCCARKIKNAYWQMSTYTS